MHKTFLVAMLLSLTPNLMADKFDYPSFFYGGGIGMAFGAVDYVELAPMIGSQISPNLSAGAQLTYRNTNDDRGNQSIESTDLGAALFSRFHVAPTLFLEANYEYIDRETDNNGTNQSNNFSSFLLGGGVSSPVGSQFMTFLSILYNVNYDESNSPYNDPWSIRLGMGINFR